MADYPTVSWDEGNPPGSQEKSLGATRIREVKTQIRELIGIDHEFQSSAQGSSWGRHNKLTLNIRTSDPIPDANTGCLYSKDVDSKAELYWVDEDDNVIQITSLGDSIVGLVGEVRIWSGALADIPTGWSLCDGTDGTPNLIGKFIRGVNTDATDPGGTGGADSITLDSSTSPTHNHTITAGSHKHDFRFYNNSGSDEVITGAYHYETSWRDIVYTENAHTHTISNAGSGTAYNNRPSYIEEAFIIKT